ncbi:putative ABC transport system permease protein [Keratinibaculum paraultunense]|uniref:Putative ABC transport system permease protein n=1 Tax=Keratinibaculum paraultunense TaxID=1278232 RepID=A0A4R3KS65_9FIRM|nr:ABC transporter permease [Keratinibaculum paraultunense]QQY79648.1 ABC transporter permease [Keratinibaculum paraultunense]TCS87070.1 putative ABC transport system permease protein [Keratinibaculum paraultunense]
MNSFKIAIINFKRNIRTYSLYLMAMVFSVATYYNFVSMRYNPQFLEAKEISAYIEGSSMTASMLMIMFLIFFIAYSSSFFLNQRKREIGVYAFMGIDNYKIALIFASEGLLLGIMSVIFGLGTGILFSKLFMMMLAKVALLNIRINFFISKKAIIETIILYSIILGITFLKGYLEIIKTNLIDLMNSLKKEEELPKINYFKGIVSIVIIGVAYYIAINYEKFGFGTALMVTVILIIWGTYWLFGSFFSMIIRYYINKKGFLYKGTNIISISNMGFRIKNNYRTLAAVAVLITTCITSFGTVSSLKYYVDENHKIEVPYTVTYISSNEEEIKKVDKVIENSSHNVELKNNANFLYVPDSEVVVVNLSTFKDILIDLKVENREKIISKFKLLRNEAGYIERPGVMMSILEKNDIHIGNQKYNIKVNTKVPLFGKGVPFPCIVVKDDEYEILKSKFIEKQFNGIILDNPEDTKDLTFELVKVLTEESWLYTYFVAGATFYDFTGIVYFLGAFLFLVFVFATGSIIYFKILSESFGDKNKYEILKKLGTTDLEIHESVSKQIGMFFILPLVVGIIHSMVAISVLSDIMKCNLIKPTIVSIGVFALMYGIFYVFTRRKYIDIVSTT